MYRHEYKIFDGPDHISEVKNLPWKTVISADFHVSVFANPDPNLQDRLIFAPRYNKKESFVDATVRAAERGAKMVGEGKCDDFYVHIMVENVIWPHLILVLGEFEEEEKSCLKH